MRLTPGWKSLTLKNAQDYNTANLITTVKGFMAYATCIIVLKPFFFITDAQVK
jgi:hypothetical protein